MSLEQIEKKNVLDRFPELINAWCESNSKTYKLKKEMMCQKAIEVFGDTLSPNFIRKCIDSKYKVKYRQKNARLGILKKLGSLESEIKENLYQSSVYERK